MTKPIELGAKKTEKKADLPKANKIDQKIDKAIPNKPRPEVLPAVAERTEAEIMTLTPPRARRATAKPEIINQIGQCLGRVYNDVLKQPVPDRFLELLQALETGNTLAPEAAARGAEAAGKPEPARASAARKKDHK